MVDSQSIIQRILRNVNNINLLNVLFRHQIHMNILCNTLLYSGLVLVAIIEHMISQIAILLLAALLLNNKIYLKRRQTVHSVLKTIKLPSPLHTLYTTIDEPTHPIHTMNDQQCLFLYRL